MSWRRFLQTGLESQANTTLLLHLHSMLLPASPSLILMPYQTAFYAAIFTFIIVFVNNIAAGKAFIAIDVMWTLPLLFPPFQPFHYITTVSPSFPVFAYSSIATTISKTAGVIDITFRNFLCMRYLLFYQTGFVMCIQNIIKSWCLWKHFVVTYLILNLNRI